MNVYYQVIDISRADPRKVRDYRTEAEAIAKCEEGFGADYMGTYHLTYRKVWTSLEGDKFDKLFK
jgi:hypothetical protein